MFCLFLCLHVSIWGQNMSSYHETDQSVISSNPLNGFWVRKNNPEETVTWYYIKEGGQKPKKKKNPHSCIQQQRFLQFHHHKTKTEKNSPWFVLVEPISQPLTLGWGGVDKLHFKFYARIKPNPYLWIIWNCLSKLLWQQSRKLSCTDDKTLSPSGGFENGLEGRHLWRHPHGPRRATKD